MTAAERVLSREELAARLAGERSGRTVVFTNGCFDILHIGHVRTLEAAAAYGDILVVGVNSDASVRRLKGPDRPIVSQRERAEVIAALRPVTYAVVFEDDTPIETLSALKPDVHVKGGDYDADAMPETPVVRGYGGRVEVVPFVEGFSTTDVIGEIARRHGRKTA